MVLADSGCVREGVSKGSPQGGSFRACAKLTQSEIPPNTRDHGSESDGSDVGCEANLGVPDPMRRTGPGPPESPSWPESEPEATEDRPDPSRARPFSGQSQIDQASGHGRLRIDILSWLAPTPQMPTRLSLSRDLQHRLPRLRMSGGRWLAKSGSLRRRAAVGLRLER